MNTPRKPLLSFWQIWNMSFGFLGIQYGFGLQQANLSPIFRYLNADESKLPILWLAGPITGLLIQPLIGAISDGTWSRWGRRKPFLVIGAIIGSIAVLFMPYSPSLWIATGLFWILDASMNTAQEPYRALVGDKLNDQQRTLGFSVQTLRRCSSKNGSRFQRDLGSHQRDAERIETNLVGEVFYLVRASVDVAVHGAFHRPTLLQCADS